MNRGRRNASRPGQVALERFGARVEPIQARDKVPHLDPDGTGLLPDHHVPSRDEDERDRHDQAARAVRKMMRVSGRSGMKEARHMRKV